jgi:hypothetical protein
VLQLGQQFSGINAVFYYSTSFFENAGISNPWMGSLLACGVNVIGTMAAVYLMDIAGRRLLLLISAFGMAATTVALTWVTLLVLMDGYCRRAQLLLLLLLLPLLLLHYHTYWHAMGRA